MPPELYDRYLWFYRDLEQTQHELVYKGRRGACSYLIAGTDAITNGVAAIRRRTRVAEVNAHSRDSQTLLDLLAYLANRRGRGLVRLTVAEDEALANAAGTILCSSPRQGSVKYYTNQVPVAPALPVREMALEDGRVVARLRPRRWPAYRTMIGVGTRFFGLIVEDEIKAMCGLVRLTGFQSQIIGVETFGVAERRKGFGKAVSSLALKEGLRDASFVTWSTSQGNAASCRTAESLGMRPYFRLFTIEGRTQGMQRASP